MQKNKRQKKRKNVFQYNHLKIITKYKSFKNNSRFIYSRVKNNTENGQVLELVDVRANLRIPVND